MNHYLKHDADTVSPLGVLALPQMLMIAIALGLTTSAHAGPWEPPEQQTDIDIRENQDGRQIKKTGEISMIGSGPWRIRFNLKQPGDISVNEDLERSDLEPLGEITKRINSAQQEPYSYEIEVKRTLDPLLDNFYAYAAAQSDLHRDIDFENVRRQIAKGWNRQYDKKLAEGKRYLVQHKISLRGLSNEAIRDLCTRMQSYDRRRDAIIQGIKQIRDREKDWKIKAPNPRSSSELLAEQYCEAHSLELIKKQLIDRYGNTWQTKAHQYLDRLGVDRPDSERKLLQSIDAMQIVINGRFTESDRNKKQFNAALSQKEKQTVEETLTFPWRLAVWPFAHPQDPNSWINRASPVPVHFGRPGKVNVLIHGSLDPKANDRADWWEVPQFDQTQVVVEFNGDRKAKLVGPIRHQVADGGKEKTLLRVVVNGEEAIKYRISVRSKSLESKIENQIYEPVAIEAQFPY